MWEIAVIFGLISVIVVFTLLSLLLGGEHYFLKMFFLLLSFLFVGVGLYMIKEISESNYSASVTNILTSVYVGYIYVFSFIVLYFVVKAIATIVSSVKDKKNSTGLEDGL